MVGTAQAADFAIFMRKIGYSVGLENLVSRASDFGRVYAASESFRDADWIRLVREVWALKSDHIGDVFASLRIVRLVNREPIPGPIGEALGILARRLDGEHYQRAVRFLVLLAVIYQDGDVFLNALASSFGRDEFQSSLQQVIRSKREILFSLFGSYQEQEAVFKAIAIERQRTNRGSSGGKTLDSLARGRSLSDRALKLGLPKKIDLSHLEEPSEDYLDKVLVTRRGWAEALDLYHAAAITDKGIRLLSMLREREFGHGAGPFLVWPTAFEIVRARFDLGTFSALPIYSTLGFMRSVAESQCGQAVLRSSSFLEDSFVPYVEAVYRDFRALSQNRSMIRNELPLEVLGAVWYAENEARETLFELESSLFDTRSSEAGLIIRTSQTIEMAITAKRRESISSH